ncbi:hypothetical protein ACUYOF_22785 [Photobacterium ganghwense]|uniref:hypothetical protein n=1 Tax=Photobacterium TaxID=657 RepID=UPI002361EF81|nr:hypothetical protein [Photobacterium sp. GSS17]
MRTRIPLRLLELNSPMMWQWPHIEEIVALMQRQHFNGLIFHQENLWSLLAHPSPHCRFERENLERGRIDSLLFLKRVIRYCKQHGIGVWLQGAANPTDGLLLQKYPEYPLIDSLEGDELFWCQFLNQVMSGLFHELPEVRGVIVNLAPPEVDRISLESLLGVLNRITRAHGKRLVVRDYMESKWQRWHFHNAINAMPPDVRISLKATQSGYRPGLPNNPTIAELPGRLKWVEYDMWGVEFGWTLLPCYLLEEIQGRLCWANAVGGEELEAISCKMSWEWVSNSSLVNSINSVNLQGLAMYSYELELSEKDAFRCWLNDVLQRQVSNDEAQRLHLLFTQSFEWIRKTPYMLGHLLQTHSQIPESYEQALQLLFSEQYNMDPRYVGQSLFSSDDPQTGLEELHLIKLEKERARFLAQQVRAQAHELTQAIAMPAHFRDLVLRVYERVPWYTEMFTRVCQGVAARYFIQRYHRHPEAHRLLNHEIDLMRMLAVDLDNWLDEGRHRHPHYLSLLFDPQRLLSLAGDLAQSDD